MGGDTYQHANIPLVEPGAECSVIREEDSNYVPSPFETMMDHAEPAQNARNRPTILPGEDINAGLARQLTILPGSDVNVTKQVTILPGDSSNVNHNANSSSLNPAPSGNSASTTNQSALQNSTDSSHMVESLLDAEETKEFLEYYEFDELRELELLFREADGTNTGFLQAEGLLSVLQQIQMEGIDSNPSLDLCQELVDKSRGRKEDMGEIFTYWM
jgi:hypothetical protein